MGATDSKTASTVNKDGETVWNASPATFKGGVPQIVENYPYEVWETGSILGEEY